MNVTFVNLFLFLCCNIISIFILFKITRYGLFINTRMTVTYRLIIIQILKSGNDTNYAAAR